MTSKRPSVDSVFCAALEIESEVARAAYVEDACSGDETLKRQVEKLLDAHFHAGSFLDQPAPELDETVEPDIGIERPGQIIGRYKLRETLGAGGFGVVWAAEQTEPVQRKVALKIIKPGMDTQDVIARFEAERQALAMMDHQNIARVLDAGTTEQGRPYFVMELIRGVPITEYCDENKLTVPERLELMVQVCKAVQHAHQKGIIHRDIKPSNVLVTLHDGVPVSKVIDFGVAKALNQRLTEKTIYTRVHQAIGTLAYMSPEQAELSGLDVDTRADIYGLGVLLYELLTGTTPFDTTRLEKAAFHEACRIIREEEPPKASTKLSSLGETVTAVSAQRKTGPRELAQLVRGDLDWILVKALEKDRTRRYESASAFAADVRCYLNDEPIEARPPSTAYRLRKLASRHRVELAMTAAVMVTLMIGVVVSAWLAVVMYNQREEARRQQKIALAAQVEADRQRESAEAAQQKAELLATDLQETLDLLQHELLDRAFRLARAGDVEEVDDALRRARSTGAPDDVLRTIRGIAYMYNGDGKEAVRLLKEVLEDNPDSLAARCALHLSSLSNSSFSSFEEITSSHEQIGRASNNERGNDHALLLLAETKIYGSMNLPGLIQDLDEIISRHKRWGVAYAVRSQAKVQLGQLTRSMELLKDALSDAEEARKYSPDNPCGLTASLNAYNYLLQLAAHNGLDTTLLREQAKGIAEELERWPNADYWHRLMFYYLVDQEQELRDLQREVFARGHGSPQPELAVLLQRDDRSELFQFAEKDPSLATPQIAVAIRYALDGDPEEALKILEKLENGPAPTNTRCLMLDIPSIAQRPDIAKRSAKRILERLPDYDPPTHWRYEVWEAEYVAGLMSEEELLRRAGPFHLESGAVHWVVGMNALAHGDAKKAREHLEIAAGSAFPGAWGTAFSRAYLNLMGEGRLPIGASMQGEDRDGQERSHRVEKTSRD